MLRSIIDVDITEGYITTASEFVISWRDEFLVWNSSHYNGIDRMPLQSNTFWTPDITVVDAVAGIDLDLIENRYSPTWVTSDGVVSVFPTATYMSKCSINGKMYPFDKHKCFVQLISAKYGPKDIKINNSVLVKSENFNDNVLWEIMEAKEETRTYFKDSYQFIKLQYTVTVSRKVLFSTFYTYLSVAGMLLLNVISRFVSLESGVRLSYCVTIYLAVVIASETLYNTLPNKSEHVSLTAIILVLYMFITTLTVAWTVLITCLSVRTTSVPDWISRVLQIASRKDNMQESSYKVEETLTEEDEDINSLRNTKKNADDETTASSADVSWSVVCIKLDVVYFYFVICFYTCCTLVGTITLIANDVI